MMDKFSYSSRINILLDADLILLFIVFIEVEAALYIIVFIDCLYVCEKSGDRCCSKLLVKVGS